MPAGASSPATIRPTSRSTSRSIPIAAASTAASIATPGPSHAYLGLSAGLDFETKIFAKHDAAPLLRQRAGEARLSLPADRARHQHRSPTSRWSGGCGSRARSSRCWPQCRHPVTIVTKSALVLRDLDLLAPMAARRPGARLGLGDHARSRARAHPRAARRRAASPAGDAARAGRRRACRRRHGGADHPGAERPRDRGRARGGRGRRAGHAGYVLLRLPHEVKDLFAAWLEAHAPLARRPRALADPPVPRRPPQRSELRHPDARPGRLCRADRQRFARPGAGTASTAPSRRSGPTCSSRRSQAEGSCACCSGAPPAAAGFCGPMGKFRTLNPKQPRRSVIKLIEAGLTLAPRCAH